MLTGEKILVTGASGLVGMQLARFLAEQNEVWGLGRYSDAASREQVAAAGIKPVVADLGTGQLDAVPGDFTCILHLAHTRLGPDQFHEAIEVNAIGAGLLLQHCRAAKAALVVSSTAVYSPPADVFQPIAETAPIGRAWTPWAPSSPASKVSLEAVARFAARAFALPTTIMRLNTCYGPAGGMPVGNMRAIASGQPIGSFADPYPHSPIHFDDMCDQIEALLGAASIHAPIINWCGDEAVTQRQWCEYASQFSGKPFELNVHAIPGTPNGNIGDPALRQSITGPCGRGFKTSLQAIYTAEFG